MRGSSGRTTRATTRERTTATNPLAATWTDRASAAGVHARKALAYVDAIKRVVNAAKDPASGESAWDELTALIDTAAFVRVGNDKAVMGWDVYRNLITQWAGSTDYWDELRHVSEAGNRVFLELTEHNTPQGGAESVVNSCSVYWFDDGGKLIHLGIYLQHD